MTSRIEIAAPSTVAPAHAAFAPRAGATFAVVLERALRSVDRAEAGPPASSSGALDARAALELQAAVYRHAERVELASKLLDHGLGAVKTILQTRI